MPDSWDYKIIAVRRKDNGYLNTLRARLLEPFPPRSLDSMPIDFIERCAMDSRPEFAECVVLRYKDGTMPTAQPNIVMAKTYPTYKGMPGKKASAMGRFGDAVKKGSVIMQECRNIYCVHQAHLTLTNAVVDTGEKAAATYHERKAQGYYIPPAEKDV